MVSNHFVRVSPALCNFASRKLLHTFPAVKPTLFNCTPLRSPLFCRSYAKKRGGKGVGEENKNHKVFTFDSKLFESQLTKSLQSLSESFATLKAGRASPSYLEHVKVTVAGKIVPLQQFATVALKDPNNLLIKVFELDHLSLVETSIKSSVSNVSMTREGKNAVIVNIPKVTKELRQELAKQAKKMAEDAKNRVRRHRSKVMDDVKKMHTDDKRLAEKEIETIQKSFFEKIEKLLTNKISDLNS